MSRQSPTRAELLAQLESLQAENKRLKRKLARKTKQLAEKQRIIEQLRTELREAHRQAAPFRRRESTRKPSDQKKKPGARPGHPGTHRPRPPKIDREIEVPLADCPRCHGKVSDLQPRVQYIEEIPPIQPMCFKVTTWTGVCESCGQVHSTHPLQTSCAVGAAGNHLGPRALSLAVTLSHQTGMSMRKVCQTLETLSGLKLSPGGLAQLLQRASRKLGTFYQEIKEQIRQSEVVYADETSWYVGEPNWWLWVFTNKNATLYRVTPGRGSDVVEDTLGADFAGMLVSDCLSSYDPITCRKHKCVAHHLRALKQREAELAKRGVKSQYLFLWKMWFEGLIETSKYLAVLSPEELAKRVVQLTQGAQKQLNQTPEHPEEVKFLNRLKKQQAHLMGCLSSPEVEATNNRAERDLRPAVISRKISCGNRSDAGREAWQIVRSCVVTLGKQGVGVVSYLEDRLRL